MTATSRRLFRRLLKPAAYVAMILAVCWCGWSAIELDRLDRRVRAWTALALEQDLLFSDRMVCMIPGLELNPVGRMFMARRHVMVVAYRDTDADAILTMPECPVRLLVVTGPQVREDHRQRLRDRFGPENVE